MLKSLYFRIVNYFSQHPERYSWIHAVLLFGLPYRRVVEAINAQPTDRILDVACGPALIRSMLPSCAYLGVDLNERHIDYAKGKYSSYPETIFRCADVLNLSVEEQFDKILMLGFMHHLSDDDLHKVLGELKPRVLDKLITFDPVKTKYHWFSNILCILDQGRFVRTAEQYENIILKHFKIKRRQIFPSKSLAEMFVVYECFVE